MLSWAVWFKFLLDKVIANTCSFLLTSFSKQSASWKVLDICELCALSTDSRKTYLVNNYMYTGRGSYGFDWGGGRNGKDPISVFCCISLPKWKRYMKRCWVFSVISSQPHWKNYYSPPALADMLSWAISFKFLLNKVIANTCLFTLTSFSKQSASRKVLEICELCALSIDSRKTYSVNKYMFTGTGSYGFDWGGGRNGKDPIYLFCCISLPKWKHYMKRYWVFSVISSQPHWQNYYFPLGDMLSWAVWFKFLLDKVIANTCSFLLTSFSKQSASWKVLEICEMCALSTDSPKTYSVNKFMYTGSNSYIFDWGGGRNGKDPISLFCCISLPKWKHYMRGCLVFSVYVHW